MRDGRRERTRGARWSGLRGRRAKHRWICKSRPRASSSVAPSRVVVVPSEPTLPARRNPRPRDEISARSRARARRGERIAGEPGDVTATRFVASPSATRRIDAAFAFAPAFRLPSRARVRLPSLPSLPSLPPSTSRPSPGTPVPLRIDPPAVAISSKRAPSANAASLAERAATRAADAVAGSPTGFAGGCAAIRASALAIVLARSTARIAAVATPQSMTASSRMWVWVPLSTAAPVVSSSTAAPVVSGRRRVSSAA